MPKSHAVLLAGAASGSGQAGVGAGAGASAGEVGASWAPDGGSMENVAPPGMLPDKEHPSCTWGPEEDDVLTEAQGV